MGSQGFLTRIVIGAGLSLIIAGLWYLQSHQGKGPLTENWDFRPYLHEGTARIESKGRDLDLSNRDLVLSRSTHEIGGSAESPPTDQKTQAKATPGGKKKVEKKKQKKLAKKKKATKTKAQPTDSEKQNAKTKLDPEDSAPVTASSHPIPSAAPGVAARVSAEERYWRDRLLRGPDANAMTEFVEAYVSSQVDATVYYAILEEMLIDSRREMNSLAIQALDATPSYESFRLLALYEDKIAPDLLETHRAAQDRYKATVYLTVLEQGLEGKEPEVALQALSTLRLAAQEIFEEARTRAAGHPRLLRGFSSMAELDSYKNLIPALNRLSESNDGRLAEAALGVLDQLDRMQSTS